MKSHHIKYTALGLALIGLAGCAQNHDHQGSFILGDATDANIAKQSVRSVEIPNSQGLTGQSGERAVAAIGRLNSGETAELSDVSASGLGSTAGD